MAASARIQPVALPSSSSAPHQTLDIRQVAEFSGVFRGHELTRKDRHLSSGIAPLDAILGGGIVRGRISEIVARPGFGRTSLASAFTAAATRRGEVAAWIDSSGAFDPQSVVAAGVDLARVLWVGADAIPAERGSADMPAREFVPARSDWPYRTRIKPALKAAEMVLSAGGFSLVIIDFGTGAQTLALGAALRLARAAERSGAAVIVMAERRTCGTFAALSLLMKRIQPCFSRTAPGAPVLFDGMRIEAYVARNKLGGSGETAEWRALIDPSSPELYRAAKPVTVSASSETQRAAAVSAAINRDRPEAHSFRRPRRDAAYGYAR
jgi:hypothetical protein